MKEQLTTKQSIVNNLMAEAELLKKSGLLLSVYGIF